MNRNSSRRAFLRGSLAAVVLGPVAFSGAARAQVWPSRPIKIIVGFTPGGVTDLFARAYGEYLANELGQAVLVENRPGAGSIIACEAVAKAPPDGYTLLMTISTALLQNQVLYRKLPYDPNKDFTYIAALDPGNLAMAVHRGVPAGNFRDFIEFARRNRVNFGSYAPASLPHMVAVHMNKLFGTQVEPVHFKGEPPMWQELSAGRLHAAIGSQVGMMPVHRTGAVRPIAVNTTVRSPKLPDVPTFAEQGFTQPFFTARPWIGVLGPAGVPKEVVTRISSLIGDATDTPRLRQLRDTFGITGRPSTPEEVTTLFREEGPIWIAAAKEVGVTLE